MKMKKGNLRKIMTKLKNNDNAFAKEFLMHLEFDTKDEEGTVIKTTFTDILAPYDWVDFLVEYADWSFLYPEFEDDDTEDKDITALAHLFSDFKWKHQDALNKVFKVYTLEYDPLENYNSVVKETLTTEHGEEIGTQYGQQIATEYGSNISTDYGRTVTRGYGREQHRSEKSVMGEETSNGKALDASVTFTGLSPNTYNIDVNPVIDTTKEGDTKRSETDINQSVAVSGQVTDLAIKSIDLKGGDTVETTNFTAPFDTGEKEDSKTRATGSTGHKGVGINSQSEINSGSDAENYSGIDTEKHQGEDTQKHSGTDVIKHSGTDTNTRQSTTKGNIGVTTSQQMLQSELDIRFKQNIKDWIFRNFVKESFFLDCWE